MSAPELLRSELVLESRPFNVTHDTIRFSDGGEASRAVVQHPGAVAIVALDGQGRLLLLRQYRHPARRELLEIPAGTREPGEAPEVTAARELREETGFAAGQLERIGGTWMAPGYCSEYIDYFVATALRHDPLPQDEDEHLSPTVAMTFDEVLAAIDGGQIEDAKTIVAVTLAQRRQQARDSR